MGYKSEDLGTAKSTTYVRDMVAQENNGNDESSSNCESTSSGSYGKRAMMV